jgi:hypothetical protein
LLLYDHGVDIDDYLVAIPLYAVDDLQITRGIRKMAGDEALDNGVEIAGTGKSQSWRGEGKQKCTEQSKPRAYSCTSKAGVRGTIILLRQPEESRLHTVEFFNLRTSQSSGDGFSMMDDRDKRRWKSRRPRVYSDPGPSA